MRVGRASRRLTASRVLLPPRVLSRAAAAVLHFLQDLAPPAPAQTSFSVPASESRSSVCSTVRSSCGAPVMDAAGTDLSHSVAWTAFGASASAGLSPSTGPTTLFGSFGFATSVNASTSEVRPATARTLFADSAKVSNPTAAAAASSTFTSCGFATKASAAASGVHRPPAPLQPTVDVSRCAGGNPFAPSAVPADRALGARRACRSNSNRYAGRSIRSSTNRRSASRHIGGATASVALPPAPTDVTMVECPHCGAGVPVVMTSGTCAAASVAAKKSCPSPPAGASDKAVSCALQ